MNNTGKRILGLFLALSLTAAVFAGCSSPADSSSAGASSQASSDASGVDEVGSSTDYAVGLEKTGYFQGITAGDYVTLPENYMDLELPEEQKKVSEEDVQSRIDSLMSAYGTTSQVTDRAVEDGDTVNIDYVGSVDGVEFAGGNTGGNGTDVTIGVTNYIDDFLDQLVGHKPGETFDVNVTFPDPYSSNTDLSGKDAVFVTTINYITENTSPELDDAFVKENMEDVMGWTTAQEAKDGIREIMIKQQAGDYLWEQLSSQVEVSQVPESVQKFYENMVREQYVSVATQSGYATVEEYMESLGTTFESTLEQAQATLEESAKESLALQAIAEANKIEVTRKDMGAYVFLVSGNFNVDVVTDFYGEGYLALIVKENLAKQTLIGE